MYEGDHSVLLTMRQMTVEFLWKTKIHCSGGVEDVRLRGVTTWTPAVFA